MTGYSNSKQTVSLLFILLFSIVSSGPTEAKVVDFGLKLPEFVQENPSKSWLIKFYAPWCYHCQQLEPTYLNVAEKIYHNHDHLIVGRVDCTKYGQICEKYGVQSYPTIAYLSKDLQVNYKGDRSLESLVNFAERLRGPDVRDIDDCKNLRSISENHGLIILKAGDNQIDLIEQAYQSISTAHKSTHWFYQAKELCAGLIDEPGIYMLKRHLSKAIKFDPDHSSPETYKKQILDWINKESLPIFGPINSVNFDKVMASGKLLILAVVDEYKPARRLSQQTKSFFSIFEELAKKYAEQDDGMLFVWSSDLDLIQSIVIGKIQVPNAIVLKPDYSYHLQVTTLKEPHQDGKQQLPNELEAKSIKVMIADAKSGKLQYQGGSSILHSILRYLYSQYNRYANIYHANPLLASILIGFPGVIVLFVIYTTCCYENSSLDGDNERDDEEDYDEDEEEALINHAKQD